MSDAGDHRIVDDAPWHSTTHRLRLSDNDAVGHVNNAVYAVMFEAGRTELLDAAGVLDRRGSLAAVIVRLEIDFKHEMSWPGDVTVQSAVVRFGTKTVHIRQRVMFRDRVVADGLSVLAFIDRETRRAVLLDGVLRGRFARWALPGAC